LCRRFGPVESQSQAMNSHLQEISFQVYPDAHIVLIRGRAGWHRNGGKLRIPNHITLLHLLHLLHALPELNPAENIRQFLRHNQLSNRIYND
jgi:hypothetical protein